MRPTSLDRRSATAAGVIAISLVLVVTAERDIHRRPDSQIRGNKTIWRLACLNALGAVVYLISGRR